jgi:outer membrane immunogenic protein
MLLFAGAAAAAFDGAYYGVNAGVFSAKVETAHHLDKPSTSGPAGQPQAVESLGTTIKDTNIIGGVQGGYLWRLGAFAYGAEVDASYINLNASENKDAAGILNQQGNTKVFHARDSVTASWVATLRPRVGFVIADRSMAYLSAGLAVSNVNYQNDTFADTVNGSAGHFVMQTSKKNGKVFGAGYEWSWSNNRILRLDYQHFDFGTATASGSFPGTFFNDLAGSTVSTSWKLKYDVLRVGVNWKF